METDTLCTKFKVVGVEVCLVIVNMMGKSLQCEVTRSYRRYRKRESMYVVGATDVSPTLNLVLTDEHSNREM